MVVSHKVNARDAMLETGKLRTKNGCFSLTGVLPLLPVSTGQPYDNLQQSSVTATA